MNSGGPVPHVSLMMDTFIANSDVEDLRAICRALLVAGSQSTRTAFQSVAKQRLRRTRTSRNDALPGPLKLYIPASDRQLYYSSSSASSASSLPSAHSSIPSSSLDSSKLALNQGLDATHSDPLFSSSARRIQSRARALFGAGLGLDSLQPLTTLVRGTSNLRWSEDGAFVDVLAALDGDISQAVQSTWEELSSALRQIDATSSDDAVSSPPAPQEHDLSTAVGPLANIEEMYSALKDCEKEMESWGGEFPFQRGLVNIEWLQQSDLWIRSLDTFRNQA